MYVNKDILENETRLYLHLDTVSCTYFSLMSDSYFAQHLFQLYCPSASPTRPLQNFSTYPEEITNDNREHIKQPLSFL